MPTAQTPAPASTQTSSFAPRISGPLPGPNARAILEGDDRWISPSYTRSLSPGRQTRPRHASWKTSTATSSWTSPPASPSPPPATAIPR